MNYKYQGYVVVELYKTEKREILVTQSLPEAKAELSRLRRVGDYEYAIYEIYFGSENTLRNNPKFGVIYSLP